MIVDIKMSMEMSYIYTGIAIALGIVAHGYLIRDTVFRVAKHFTL